MIKKLILTALALLALSGNCFAAGEEKLLDKYQRVCYKMIDIFDGGTVPAYSTLVPYFSDALKAKFDSAQYDELVKAIMSRYGVASGIRFALFERLDGVDRVAYFANFPKDPDPVLVAFNFLPDGKMDALILSSKNQQPQNQQRK